MEEVAINSFVDTFFYFCLVFVAVLALTDFLLGKEGREKVRELIGEWWIYLEDSSYAGLGASDAARILGWFRNILGPIVSLRFWVLIFPIAFLLLVTVLHLVFTMPDGVVFEDLFESISLIFLIFGERGFLIPFANTILPVLSFVLTLGFLKLMSSSSSFVFLSFLTICDLIVAIALIIVTVMIVQSHRTWDVFDFGNVLDQYVWIAGGLLSLFPTALHVFLTSLFVISKLTAPILRKPVNLVLLRLNESEKGALSLIGVAIGTIAKLIQEGLKLV